MKIAIVGAGIVGVATAWELSCDGHEVMVFDRRSAAAEEASFAHAGLLMPGHTLPWDTPSLPGVLRALLFAPPGALRLRWPLRGDDLAFVRRWREARRLATDLASRARVHRFGAYSLGRLHAVTDACALDYERGTGQLVLLRGKRESQAAQPGLDLLREAGVPLQEVDADEARRIEPGLATDTALAGAIHLPQAEAGNGRQFAMLLKREAEARGAQFHFGCDIAPLSRAQPRALALQAGSDAIGFDAVVVCAGADAARLLAPLGVRLPLTPLYGHSVSAGVREPLSGPRGTVVDARHQVVFTRLGQRMRVTGGAELGGVPGTVHPQALAALHKVLNDWFPRTANLPAGVLQWKGARPMLPDGLPVLGGSGVPGVWLNLGHGASGWALACGSARALADLVGGRPADVDLQGLGLERLRG